jgi:hypothetical protein
MTKPAPITGGSGPRKCQSLPSKTFSKIIAERVKSKSGSWGRPMARRKKSRRDLNKLQVKWINPPKGKIWVRLFVDDLESPR